MRTARRAALVLLLTCLLLSPPALAVARAHSRRIKYVIVIMMENRSFIHMLGNLNKLNPEVQGLKGNETNPVNVSDPHSPLVPVNDHTEDGGPFDPCHSFDCITRQVYGFDKPANETALPTMKGFVQDAVRHGHPGSFVMGAWNASSLPILYTLAQEFAVFDQWFCSSPTPTNPNREFLMSGTSAGVVTNDIPYGGFKQQTHYDFLQAHNVTWKIFYSDNPWGALFFHNLRQPENKHRVRPIEELWGDISSGDLPQYTFIEPRMSTSARGPSNWQHPDNSVEAGEQLLKQLYETLRASPIWEESLLMITYDEHGGFMDTMAPPQEGVPNPDGLVSAEGFSFDRLGIRVPTIAVSPWIEKGTVVHGPPASESPSPTSQYESTSIIATANRLFGLDGFLTHRDRWAGTFLHVLSRDTPRTDCPKKLPPAGELSEERLTAEMLRAPNDHHLDQARILCEMNERPVGWAGCTGGAPLLSQAEAADFLAEEWAAFVGTRWASQE